MGKIKACTQLRVKRLAVAGIVIVAGLVLRLTGYEAGLPYPLVKYGGSGLWGMMVFWLVAALFPDRSVRRVAVLAGVVAVTVELIRLYHTPWLDAFRLTLAGALLLGRIFSVYNILAYLAGIAAAALIDQRLLLRRTYAESPAD